MTISENGINLIKKWESFKSTPYKCSAGVTTIGYGHTRTAKISMLPISEHTASVLLDQDIYFVEAHLKPLLKGITLSQQQYDAIVSFCFNLGVGAFQRSTAYNEILINPDGKRVADSWIQYRNAGGRFLRGLLLRRLDELTMYYG